MATGAQPASTPPSRASAWIWKAIENIVVAAASAAMVKAANAVAGDWIAQPWQAVWVLLPIAAAATLGWNSIRGTGRLRLDRRFALFLCIYVTLFSTAANFRFLDWNRHLTLFGKPAPPNRIAPARFGDWRYAFLPKRSASPPGLVVIKTPPAEGRGRDELRHEVAWFIAFANKARAKGIAFDFYFVGESPFDREVCYAIQNSGIPVFAGYRLVIHEDGAVSPDAKLPGLLDSCMKGRLGHLAGFAESDEKVRSVPLFLNDDRDQPALSWRVATALAHDRKLSSPSDGLLRYIEPAPGPDFLAVTLDQLREDRDNVRMRLAERFLLVGEDSKQETFATPFGDRLGVMIHAGAVDSLLAGAYVRKSPWWSVVMLIMLASYAVAWPASRGMGLRWILAGAAAATLACFVFAAAAAYAASVWIDVVYPALAAFLLVPLVTIFRRVPPLR